VKVRNNEWSRANQQTIHQSASALNLARDHSLLRTFTIGMILKRNSNDGNFRFSQ